MQTLPGPQDPHREWRGRVAGIPRRVRDRGVARADPRSGPCRCWRPSSCPGASGVTARPPATASPRRPRSGAGRRHPEAVEDRRVVRPGSHPPPDALQLGKSVPRSCGDGRRVNALARVLRYATALRVTHRPPPRSDSSCGPCGPAWTGTSRPSTTSPGTRRTADGQSARSTTLDTDAIANADRDSRAGDALDVRPGRCRTRRPSAGVMVRQGGPPERGAGPSGSFHVGINGPLQTHLIHGPVFPVTAVDAKAAVGGGVRRHSRPRGKRRHGTLVPVTCPPALPLPLHAALRPACSSGGSDRRRREARGRRINAACRGT